MTSPGAGLGLDKTELLPCDVLLPPATIIRKGCALSTLLLAMERREGLGLSWTQISSPRPSASDEDVERVARAIAIHWGCSAETFNRNPDVRKEWSGYARAAIAAMSAGTPAQIDALIKAAQEFITHCPSARKGYAYQYDAIVAALAPFARQPEEK